MHLVYSAPQSKKELNSDRIDEHTGEKALRYMAYLETCEKYRSEIAAIRKYFPGWTPEFR